MTKKPDPSVLGSNIQPLDAEALAAAVGSEPKTGVHGIDPAVLAAAIAHVQAQKVEAEPGGGIGTSPATQAALRIRKIILDPHEDIPSNGGLYVGYNGRQFFLPTNRPVLVPQGVVGVLDDAVLAVAVRDPDTLKYMGSRPQRRFQYRFAPDDPGELAKVA